MAIYYGKNNGNFPASREVPDSPRDALAAGRGSAAAGPTYDTANGKVTLNATVANCP